MIKKFINKLLQPLLAVKKEYIPIFTIYFFIGFNALAGVAFTIFYKDTINLSNADLTAVYIWAYLPWSIKMVFGSLIDGFKIFGNNRKSYIIFGQVLIFIGLCGLVDHASTQYIFNFIGQYAGLLLTSLVTQIGIVISDIIADTMAIEVVKKGPEREKELGKVQALIWIYRGLGAAIGAIVSGWLASILAISQVFTLLLIAPIVIVVSTYFTKLTTKIKDTVLNKKILFTGTVYGVFCILSGLLFKDAQLIVFIVSFSVIILMLYSLLKSMPKKAKMTFVLSMSAIFLFRIIPHSGEAVNWFYMDVIGFDTYWLGIRNTLATCSALFVLWFLMDYITGNNIFKTMLWLIVLMTLLSIPDILIYYGIPQSMGIAAKGLALLDTALIAPLSAMAMIPLGVIIANNAPEKERAIYIGLTASFMNVALLGGEVMSTYFQKIWIVTRGNYGQLGELLIACLGISTILSIIGLIILKRSKV